MTQCINPIVEVKGLGKQVATQGGELILLKGINFNIRPGEAIAISGASGSGKSTLLGILAGLDIPSEGQVYIGGEDIFLLDEDGRALLRRDSIGFVFQSFQLLPNLTALENVMLPLELADNRDAPGRANEILTRVGLQARLSHYPRYLSGGEQQRVAIARAFVSQPKLLFADEPTGNLDSVTGRCIIDLLFEINEEHGATLVMVTHDENLARRCIRTLYLDAGRMTA